MFVLRDAINKKHFKSKKDRQGKVVGDIPTEVLMEFILQVYEAVVSFKICKCVLICKTNFMIKTIGKEKYWVTYRQRF